MKTLKRAKTILDIEIKELQKVRRNLNTGFSRAVILMRDALDKGGKIVVTGVDGVKLTVRRA